MTKSVKIGVGIGILGAAVGAYFLIQYFKLKKAYSTTLSEPDAAILIQQKIQNVGDTIIPDEVTKNADEPKGTETDDQGVALHEFELSTGYGDY
jgi:hypothetical protein